MILCKTEKFSCRFQTYNFANPRADSCFKAPGRLAAWGGMIFILKDAFKKPGISVVDISPTTPMNHRQNAEKHSCHDWHYSAEYAIIEP